MNKMVMRIDDSEEEDQDFNIKLGKLFRKFIRMKDIDKFRQAMRLNDQCGNRYCKQKKQRSCKDANNNDYKEDSDDSDEEEIDPTIDMSMDNSDSSSDEIDMQIKRDTGDPFEWYKTWREISGDLESLKINNETHLSLEHFTLLLKLHIEHKFVLDMNCYRTLLHCIKPELIEAIFDMNLIDFEDTFHIGCLIESNDFFAAIDLEADNIGLINKYAYKILLSLSVLIYKDKECLNHSKKLQNSLNNHLAVFINREDKDSGRKLPQVNALLIASVRQIVMACALNGLFVDQQALNSFLKNNQSENMEDSMDTSDLSEASSDDSEEEMIERLLHRHHMMNGVQANRPDRPYNPRSPPLPGPPRIIPNNNNALPTARTVADRIYSNGSSDLISKLMFPMSLKNLSRLAIKKSMNPYNLTGVNTLSILPNVLKKYLLFQGEIDEIIKLSQN